jgi:transcription termination factor NusB
MSSPASSLPEENYFEYFTEIEECYRRCRGTPVMISTLDWALLESWREAGVPLTAVLQGIERTFEKYAKRPRRFSKVNSLAYCSQAVLEAADALAAGRTDAARRPSSHAPRAPFTREQIQGYLRGNARAVRDAAAKRREAADLIGSAEFEEAATALERIADGIKEAPENLEPIENEVSALEEKLTASATRACAAEMLAGLRAQVQRGIAPYRSKMSAPQLDLLERQMLKRALYEHYHLPRLSTFYLNP